MPHKRGHKKTKKVRKGGFYSFNGAVAPGAANWGRGSEYGDFAESRVGNNAIYGRGRGKKGGEESDSDEELKERVETLEKKVAGRRRRSMKKKGRKTRKVRRGGGKQGAVSASYTGTGERGMANYVQSDTKGVAALGAFNNQGAQPGSGFGSFVRS